MKIKNNNNNIFIWSPMTSHVGTIMATMGMVSSLKTISGIKNKIFLINVFGEFNFLKIIRFDYLIYLTNLTFQKQELFKNFNLFIYNFGFACII